MKTHYIWIFLCTALGLSFSYYLIPSLNEIALIEFKEKKYERALQYYKKAYREGHKSAEVVIPLAKIYQQKGDLSQAIFLLREYTAAHPQDVYALKILADLYFDDQQYDAYFATLALMKALGAQPDMLEDLAAESIRRGETKDLVSVLESLIISEKANAGYFLDLAALYAEKGEYIKAKTTLEKRRAIYPNDVLISDVLFEVWVDWKLSELEGNNQTLMMSATNMLVEYLFSHPQELVISYALLHYQQNYPLYAPYLAQRIAPLLENNIRLQTIALRILWEDPSQNREEILSQIQELLAKNPKNGALSNVLWNAFIEKRETAPLLEMISSMHPGEIDEPNLISLCVFSLKNNKPVLAEKLQEALGNGYLSSHPVIAQAILIAMQSPDGEAHLHSLIKSSELTPSDRYELFRISVAAGFREEALELGASLFPFIGMPDYELAEVAMGYISIHETLTLYTLIQKATVHIGEKRAAQYLALLDIALGKTKKTALWLSWQRELPLYFFYDLYSVAEDYKEYPLALYIAKKMRNQYPSSFAQTAYGLSLIQNGKVEAGVDFLKTIPSSSFDEASEKVYLQALVLASRSHPKYLKNLLDFLSAKKGPLSEDLATDFAYAYLDGVKNIPQAESMFFALAKEAPAESLTVQTLIYIWGPNPSEEQITWVVQKALSSSSKDFGYWLSYLVSMRQYQETIRLYHLRENEPILLNARFAYMDALVFQKNTVELAHAVQKAYPLMTDLRQYQQLSLYAEAAKETGIKREIWKKMAQEYPGDASVWKNLAKAAFDAHDYTLANSALNTYQTLSVDYKSSSSYYEMLYEYGAILEHLRQYGSAKYFYRRSLDQITKEKEPTYLMQQTQADLLIQQARFSQAEKLMQKLYEMSGQNPDIAAFYANALLTQGYLQSAKALLEHALEHARLQNTIEECLR